MNIRLGFESLFDTPFYSIPSLPSANDLDFPFPLPPDSIGNLCEFLNSPEGLALQDHSSRYHTLSIILNDKEKKSIPALLEYYKNELDKLAEKYKHNNLEAFLRSDLGDLYRKNVNELIQRLQLWVTQQGLHQNGMQDVFNDFAGFFEYEGRNLYSNERMLPLLRSGVKNLYHIVKLIHHDEISLAKRKTVISHLLEGLNVCEPGVNTNLYRTYLQLSTDVRHYLEHVKRKLSEQQALMAIVQFNETVDDDGDHIFEGSEIHYTNALINRYAKELGVRSIEDQYANHHHLPDELITLFIEKINDNFTVENIIYFIVNDSVILNDLLLKNPIDITPNEIENLTIWLNQFGNDPSFNFISHIYDAENDLYRWSDGFIYQVFTTLHQRLIQQKFFLSPQHLAERFTITDDTSQPAEIALIKRKPLVFSFMKRNQQMTSLIPELPNLIRMDNVEFITALSEDQYYQMIFYIRDLLRKEWSDICSENQSDIMVAWIFNFRRHFYHLLDANPIDLINLIADLPVPEQRYQLQHEWELYPEDNINDSDDLANYARLLHPSTWADFVKEQINLPYPNDANSIASFIRIVTENEPGNLAHCGVFIPPNLSFTLLIDTFLLIDPNQLLDFCNLEGIRNRIAHHIIPIKLLVEIISRLSFTQGREFIRMHSNGIFLSEFAQLGLVFRHNDAADIIKFLACYSHEFPHSETTLKPRELGELFLSAASNSQQEQIKLIHSNYLLNAFKDHTSLDKFTNAFKSDLAIRAIRLLDRDTLKKLLHENTGRLKSFSLCLNKKMQGELWPEFIAFMHQLDPWQFKQSALVMLSMVSSTCLLKVLDAIDLADGSIIANNDITKCRQMYHSVDLLNPGNHSLSLFSGSTVAAKGIKDVKDANAKSNSLH